MPGRPKGSKNATDVVGRFPGEMAALVLISRHAGGEREEAVPVRPRTKQKGPRNIRPLGGCFFKGLSEYTVLVAQPSSSPLPLNPNGAVHSWGKKSEENFKAYPLAG